MSEPSLFERIVAGNIPAHRVYEDAHTLAFLDIGPVTRGHTLLIPKRCFVEVADLPPDVAAALGVALPKVCAALRQATGCDGLNVLQNNGTVAGQLVMHVHFHLIPRYADDAGVPDGFGFRWPTGELTDADAADLVAKARAALESA